MTKARSVVRVELTTEEFLHVCYALGAAIGQDEERTLLVMAKMLDAAATCSPDHRPEMAKASTTALP